jgi:hypothetical protein
MNDKYVHLTNVCLQKNDANFGKYEDGNCVDVREMEAYINKIYP